MPTLLKNNDIILFIGDSITDCGRLLGNPSLGNGYVKMFADIVTVREPEKQIRIINRGISGNTVEDLRNRWHEDVLLKAPDWLSIKIGINDIHRHLFETGFEFLTLARFEQVYDHLLQVTTQKLPQCRLLLIEPFFMSTDNANDTYRAKVLKNIPEYIAVVQKLSQKFGTRLVKTHDLFHQQFKHQHPDIYGDEPVHPNSAGHFLIAEAVYAALSI